MRKLHSKQIIEYNDNRISKFYCPDGKCAILGEELGTNDCHCHHINPFHISKDDSYSNLIILNKAIHQLIHLKDKAKIEKSLKSCKAFK